MRQTHAPCKVTKSTKFWGTRCSPELVLRSTDFYRLENLIFTTLARDLSDKHVRWKSIGHTVDLKAIEKINLRPNFFCRKNWFHSLHPPGGLEPFFSLYWRGSGGQIGVMGGGDFFSGGTWKLFLSPFIKTRELKSQKKKKICSLYLYPYFPWYIVNTPPPLPLPPHSHIFFVWGLRSFFIACL